MKIKKKLKSGNANLKNVIFGRSFMELQKIFYKRRQLKQIKLFKFEKI